VRGEGAQIREGKRSRVDLGRLIRLRLSLIPKETLNAEGQKKKERILYDLRNGSNLRRGRGIGYSGGGGRSKGKPTTESDGEKGKVGDL